MTTRTLKATGNRTKISNIADSIKNHKERILRATEGIIHKLLYINVFNFRDICQDTLMCTSYSSVQSFNWHKLKRNFILLHQIHQLLELQSLKTLLQQNLIELLSCLDSLQNRMHTKQILHFLLFHITLTLIVHLIAPTLPSCNPTPSCSPDIRGSGP